MSITYNMTDLQPRSSPKSLIAEALHLAQRAVQLDSDNDVASALHAYGEACALISRVLNTQEGIMHTVKY